MVDVVIISWALVMI